MLSFKSVEDLSSEQAEMAMDLAECLGIPVDDIRVCYQPDETPLDVEASRFLDAHDAKRESEALREELKRA